MAKNKAADQDARPSKRTKLLSDSESSDNDAEGVKGVPLSNGNSSARNGDDGILKINQGYAKRFEHNSKREETHRLEEKNKRNGKQPVEDSDDESTSEEEDDFAQLATEELDNEIFATLKAIKSKDPRVYDSTATFYQPIEEGAEDGEKKKEKPMYLQDYHRQNLLEGGVNGEDEEEEAAPLQTYAQEQEALKRSMVSQMHAAGDDQDEGDDDGFLVKKKKSAHDEFPDAAPKRKQKRKAVDVEEADKDPETFLSNFMAARAWVPGEESRFQAMDSDDSDDERRADDFEHAYNLRFENPKSANEKLMSYGRDLAKQSVRREELTGRQRQREMERELKEQAKRERQEEKARLRNLKIDEVEKKVKQIKEAAGLRNQDVLDLDQWGKVLEEDWDDDKWEQEMEKRFGDKYYAEGDDRANSSDDEAEEQQKKKKKPKKPKFNDEIDIKDLVPDFEDDDEAAKPTFTLSDDDEETIPAATGGDDKDESEDEDEDGDKMDIDDKSAAPTKKDHKRLQADKKRASRKERQAISDLVDTQLNSTILPSSSKNKNAPQAAFRYRETSPTNFGLTARDILFADDTQLNQFAGLKKMAAFRDEEKKRRDRKTLGKKARLRQWRRETFGNVEGYKGEFADYVKEKGGDAVLAPGEGSGQKKGKKRKGAA